MKILRVSHDNHRRSFRVAVRGRSYEVPFSHVDPRPTPADRVREVFVDREIASEGFSYVLESGAEGTVHVDDVRALGRDPALIRENMAYGLTLEALKALEERPVPKRTLARMMHTSLSQVSRLLDPTYHGKGIEQMMALLGMLGREVEFRVTRSGEPRDPGHRLFMGYGPDPHPGRREVLVACDSPPSSPPTSLRKRSRRSIDSHHSRAVPG